MLLLLLQDTGGGEDKEGGFGRNGGIKVVLEIIQMVMRRKLWKLKEWKEIQVERAKEVYPGCEE